ncbi:MAG: diguanylate cyclase, partial [Calditrichia bacterium]|nr:diguanylate cyclase [Calditrichia bacterium]
KIKEIAPHTLRILITGHPDIDMALRAVNEGEIFKFLIKPYPIPDFSITLRMALGKYKLELERKNREQQNEFLSLHDSLTTLPNRVFMLNKLTQAIALAKRNNKKVGIIFIDLDRFKNVNDTMGHDVGDLLLVKVAQILKGSVREIDTVSRLGGDEFVIIMQNLHNEKETSILAKRIIELFNKPLIVDDKNCDVGLSMGISFYPKHGGNPENLLKIPDDAMYTAKKIKGNSFNTAKS